MDTIPEIFERLNFQHISSFLLDGQERMQPYTDAYQDILNRLETAVYEIVEEKFPGLQENDEVIDRITKFTSALKDIYFETGLKCGAGLMLEFFNFKPKESQT